MHLSGDGHKHARYLIEGVNHSILCRQEEYTASLFDDTLHRKAAVFRSNVEEGRASATFLGLVEKQEERTTAVGKYAGVETRRNR